MSNFTRFNDRAFDELRSWTIEIDVLDHAEGSVLIEAGRTRVICAATIEDKTPSFMKNEGKGWVTAEYSMLPRATHSRSPRERGNRLGGRTMEIQRLIGRALRCVTDLSGFGERTITIDCDVIQADGGTRVASVTGAWVALCRAFHTLKCSGAIESIPVKDSVAAVSVGVVGNAMLLDLDYEEDSNAEVDMNVVMTGENKLVEVQATAEGLPFSVNDLNSLISLAQKGLKCLVSMQRECLGDLYAGHPK